ncbi:hypothetical protein [Nocardia blacklockiae]|uniref:hypothetical protein n=1 Tax=Nocardia blacklockiae TaxID=480036 RepID=UPI00189427B7|nr:hypothetical protein [Nocardia blacklockiae]MBF6175859.1 hypothetical protein [Nocardia blacklockiae]
MTTPMSRPHESGSQGPRPGVPLPGRHLAGTDPAGFADPEQVRAEVDALLSELSAGARGSESAGLAATLPTGSATAGTDITRRARILEQAHEVLVQALATVDKI